MFVGVSVGVVDGVAVGELVDVLVGVCVGVFVGDYVLGGGEVAAMVMIEAITRLIPGVLGNPDSLAEESHNSEGYLEYPNFTKPQEWRGISVP